jgi:hypothetical protein
MKCETPKICPQCGGNNWLGTTKGPMCKQCGYIETKVAAPFISPDEDDEN